MATAAADDPVDEAFDRILKQVIGTIAGKTGRDAVANALFLLVVRCANSWKSIRTLRVHSPNAETFTIDGAVILRCIFDAYLQADTIYRDPAARSRKATAYLEFSHVDRYRAEKRTLYQNTSLAKALMASPRQQKGSERNQNEFDRVKDNYAVGKPKASTGEPRINDKWYVGSLRDFATAAGKVAEYDTFITQFCGCVHSGAYAVQSGPLMSGETIGLMAATLTARVVIMNVALHGIVLSTTDTETLEALSKDHLDP
jgi:hypothetical protein